MVQAAEPSVLDIRATLQLSFSLIRRDWPWMVLFVVAFGILPRVGGSVFLHQGYRPGSHELSPFIIYVSEAVTFSMLGYLWPLTITALGVARPGERSPSRALAIALASVPAVLPLWFVTRLQLVFRFWMAWSNWRPAGPMAGGQLGAIVLWLWLATIVPEALILLGAGVVFAVAVGERRGTVASLGRAWRLMGGNRLRFVALFLLINAAAFIPSFVWALWRAALWRSHATAAVTAINWTIFVIECSVDAVWAVAVAATYLELRRAREGVIEADVAQVFS